MPIDPQAYTVRPVEIQNPLATLGQLAQLRGMQTEQLLRQQQIQEAAIRTQDIQSQQQLRDRQLRSRENLQRIMADPQHHKDFANGDYTAILDYLKKTSSK